MSGLNGASINDGAEYVSDEEIRTGIRSNLLRRLRHHELNIGYGDRARLPPKETAAILSDTLRLLDVPETIYRAVSDAIDPPDDDEWNYCLGEHRWILNDLIGIVEKTP